MSILVDRSRIETDWACPRKRYWLTEHSQDPTTAPARPGQMGHPAGIVPSELSPALAFGLVVHAGLEAQIEAYIKDPSAAQVGVEAMMQGPEWERITDDHQDTAKALITGFFQTIWPAWMEFYEPMAVEQELEMVEGDVVFMMRPDLLLKDRRTGDIWYPDFKTFSSWNNRKWDWGLQQQLTMLACEKALGVTLTGAWVQGLSKGSGRKGVLYHPLVYGYRHPGTPGVTAPTIGSKRRSGFERFNTKDYPHGGVEGWVKRLMEKDPELVAKCFPQTAPLFLKRELMEQEIIPQIVRREEQIAALRFVHGADPDEHRSRFPINLNQCETGYGRCAYFEACHVPTIKRDPVASGVYMPRDPHHAAEQQLLTPTT